MNKKVKRVFRGIGYAVALAGLSFATLKATVEIRDNNLDEMVEQGYTNEAYKTAIKSIETQAFDKAHKEMKDRGYDFYEETTEQGGTITVNKVTFPTFKAAHWHIKTEDKTITEYNSQYDELVEEFEQKIADYSVYDKSELIIQLKEQGIEEDYVANYDKKTNILAAATIAGTNILAGVGGLFLEIKFRGDEDFAEWAKERDAKESSNNALNEYEF